MYPLTTRLVHWYRCAPRTLPCPGKPALQGTCSPEDNSDLGVSPSHVCVVCIKWTYIHLCVADIIWLIINFSFNCIILDHWGLEAKYLIFSLFLPLGVDIWCISDQWVNTIWKLIFLRGRSKAWKGVHSDIFLQSSIFPTSLSSLSQTLATFHLPFHHSMCIVYCFTV